MKVFFERAAIVFLIVLVGTIWIYAIRWVVDVTNRLPEKKSAPRCEDFGYDGYTATVIDRSTGILHIHCIKED